MSNPRVESYEPLEDKVKFAQTVTNIISVAIENKRLFKKEVEQQSFKKELELAAQVQSMLIRIHSPTMIKYKWQPFICRIKILVAIIMMY